MSDPETISALAKRVGRTWLTVWRWIHTGIIVGGNRVTLQARRVGGTWSISADAWDRFQRETNPQSASLPESPAAERQRMRREREALLARLS